jgi:hypothetical protein
MCQKLFALFYLFRRHIMQVKSFLTIALLGVLGAAGTSRASVLYSETASVSTAKAYSGVAGGNGLLGYGDDYNTGTTSTVLTGLSFYGGVQPSDTADSLKINFYDTNENLVTSLVVGNAEVQGNTVIHTLASSDFGSGISIPGSGYFIFAPFNSTGAAPAFTLGYATSPGPIVGTTLTTNAKTDDNGVFTIGNNVVGFGATPYAIVTLNGTGTATPEPASLGMLASGGLLLLRRRRA